MRFIVTLLIGLVYGLCEFMPVSGSGILYLIYSLSPSSLTSSEAGILFCFLNLGVVFAVLVYFTLHAPFVPEPLPGRKRRRRKTGNVLQNLPKGMFSLLLVSALPLLLLCFRIKVILPVEKGYLFGVAIAFACSGILLFASMRFSRGGKQEESVGIREALFVGFGQVCSVFPGLSRTAATLISGLYTGMEYEFSLDYGYLLSMPAYVAAAGLMFVRATELGINWAVVPGCFSAMLFSFCGGYFSIHLFKKVFHPEDNRIFALLSLGLAVLSLVLSLIH